MKIICIMGSKQLGRYAVEKNLEQMGFKRIILYTAREPEPYEENNKDFKFVSEEKFMDLVEKGAIVEYGRDKEKDILYGTPRPFGAQRFVVVICLNGFKELKKLYGEQVLGVYLKGSYNDDNPEAENEADIIVNGNQDLAKVTADILKALRDK